MSQAFLDKFNQLSRHMIVSRDDCRLPTEPGSFLVSGTVKACPWCGSTHITVRSQAMLGHAFAVQCCCCLAWGPIGGVGESFKNIVRKWDYRRTRYVRLHLWWRRLRTMRKLKKQTRRLNKDKKNAKNSPTESTPKDAPES